MIGVLIMGKQARNNIYENIIDSLKYTILDFIVISLFIFLFINIILLNGYMEVSNKLIGNVTGCKNIIDKEEILNDNRYEEIKTLYSFIDMDDDHIFYLINKCYENDIDPDLLLAIIWTESNFNYEAKNKYSSASGYGQFVKSTGKFIFNQLYENEEYIHEIHSKDPYIAIDMLICYFKRCISVDGKIETALIIYRGLNDKKYIASIKKKRDYIKNEKEKIKLEMFCKLSNI